MPQPRVLQLRRLVLAEATRFPELGAASYEHGAERTVAALAGSFGRLADRGLLGIDDADLPAAHFNCLVMSAPVNRTMLLGDEGPLSSDAINR